MSGAQTCLRTWIEAVCSPPARLAAMVWFSIWRLAKHCGAVHLRGLMGQLSPRECLLLLPVYPIGLALFTVFRGCAFIGRQIGRQYTDHALRIFARGLAGHYSVAGLSYRFIAALTDEQCAAHYNEPRASRLGVHIHANPTLLPYRDGDTFLDAGCGIGNETRALAAIFPHSAIHCFDVNPLALRVLRCGTAGNPRITVEQGSITDFTFLARFADASIDHLVVSNIIPYLIGPGIAASTELRQRLIDEFVRICRKSLIIVTDEVERPRDPHVEIALGNACFLRDDVAAYFEPHLPHGERFMLYAPENNAAFVFKKFAS